MEITQEMIDDAIKNCIWRKEVHGVYICRGEVAPCLNVIDKGKCDTLKTLFRGDKETEFHCGIEESGGHAYNCGDCPNKCEEWYQWDKEIKNDRLQ